MNPLDRDFAEFARTGEPAALGRVYDAVAAELLALATRLGGDPVEAEDIVQATFVAAIESAARFAHGRPVMPWLVGILNNRVRRLRRSRVRTPTPAPSGTGFSPGAAPGAPGSAADRLAAADPTPAQQVELRETSAAVAQAIEGLSPTLQPVIILHLRHGMQPAEIAYALARPPATVRSQLARGLEDMRRRLPRRQLLPGLLLAPVPRGLSAVRRAVLSHATTQGTITASLLGGVIMTKPLKLLAAAIAVLALGAGAHWLSSHDAERAGTDLTTSVPAAATAAPAVAGPGDPADAGAADPHAARTPGSTSGTATVRVTVRTSSRPIASALVELVPKPTIDGGGRPLRSTTDAEGVAQFVNVPGVSGRVLVRNTPAEEDWQARNGETVAIELVVREPAWVRGRVLEPSGAPADGAIVWLVDPPYLDSEAIDVARTKADGVFALPVWNWHCLGARAPGTVPVHREVKVAFGESIDIVLQLRSGGAGLRGTVVRGQPARPVAGALLELGDRVWPYEGRCLPDGSRESVSPFTTVTDQDGNFLFDGVPPGPTAVHVVARGSAPRRQAVDLREDTMTSVTLTLEPGVRVHGRVSLADDQSPRGTSVRAGDGFAARRTQVDPLGNYELRDVPTGWVRLTALRSQDATAQASHQLVAGTDFEWNPVLDARWSQITGFVRDEFGQPLANWWVVAHTDSPWDAGRARRTAHDGAFRFEQIRMGPEVYDLHVHPPCEAIGPGQTPTLPYVFRRPNVALGARDVQLVVSNNDMPTAWVRGRLADSDAYRGALFLVPERGRHYAFGRAGDGSFHIGPLARGKWRIEQKLPDTELIAFELQAHEDRDLGTLTLRAANTGTLDIELRTPPRDPDFAGVFEGVAALQVLHAETMQFERFVQMTSENMSVAIEPGRYLLRLCGAPIWAPPEPCEVLTGRTTKVTLAAKPAALRRIAFRHPGTAHPLEAAQLAVHDEAGALLWSQSMPPVAAGWQAELVVLPGNYRVSASTASGLKCEQPLRIESTQLTTRPIVFDLEP